MPALRRCKLILCYLRRVFDRHKYSGHPGVAAYAAQAFLITADTVVDGILPAFPHLFHPIRICDELAAHGGAVDPVF